jgi:hypothetical protein
MEKNMKRRVFKNVLNDKDVNFSFAVYFFVSFL